MIVEYNDIKLDIPDYKSCRLIGVRDEGKILCLKISFVLPDSLITPYDSFYGAGGYWFLSIDEVSVKIENENRLDILTHFYSKICEGIHGRV